MPCIWALSIRDRENSFHWIPNRRQILTRWLRRYPCVPAIRAEPVVGYTGDNTPGGSLMSSAENKQIMQHIFNELAQGNSLPLVESMADEFQWTVAGNNRWSGTFK